METGSRRLETPDWRADRHAIRIGLALHERFRIDRGEPVAILLPFGPQWAIVERGVWGLGAVSVPIGPEWPGERIDEALKTLGARVTIAATSDVRTAGRGVSVSELLEAGGFLDTPERASWWRGTARGVPPDAPLSLEPGDSFRRETQAGFARAMEELGAQATRLVESGRPDLSSRIAVYAAWADGVTRVLFRGGAKEEARR